MLVAVSIALRLRSRALVVWRLLRDQSVEEPPCGRFRFVSADHAAKVCCRFVAASLWQKLTVCLDLAPPWQKSTVWTTQTVGFCQIVAGFDALDQFRGLPTAPNRQFLPRGGRIDTNRRFLPAGWIGGSGFSKHLRCRLIRDHPLVRGLAAFLVTLSALLSSGGIMRGCEICTLRWCGA